LLIGPNALAQLGLDAFVLLLLVSVMDALVLLWAQRLINQQRESNLDFCPPRSTDAQAWRT
jgi:hypothetical protein